MAGNNMFFFTLIDVDRWNQAQWKGTVYITADDPKFVPAIGILFTDGNAGRQIFQKWREDLCERDTDELLRLAIIEGPMPGKDEGYTVHVALNLEKVEARAKALGVDPNLMMLVTRIHRMYPPPNSPNLPRFKEALAKHGMYRLIPISDPAGNMDPTQLVPHFDLAILKTQVDFRRVEDVGANDQDHVVLTRND